MSLRRYLPKIESLWLVYAAVLFVIYGWMLVSFFYYLPGYMLFMPVGDIIATLSYGLVGAFLESLLVFSLIVSPALLLRAYREDFVAYGTLTAFLWPFWMTLARIFLGVYFWMKFVDFWQITLLVILPFLLSGVLLFRATKFQKVLNWLNDRFLVFLFVYWPLSAAGLFVIILRFFL